MTYTVRENQEIKEREKKQERKFKKGGKWGARD